jgi:hypothetical protein
LRAVLGKVGVASRGSVAGSWTPFFLIRKLFPFVAMTVAWCANRSRSAVVSFSSPPKTLTHSAKARLVVTMTLRRS